MAARTGRNDICPCGSGKKYKKCCAQVRIQQAGNLMLSSDDRRPRTIGLGYPLDSPTLQMQQQAYGAYQLGQFDEAIELCVELCRRNAMAAGLYESVHLASAGRGDRETVLRTESRWGVSEEQLKRIEGYYPVDALWFRLSDNGISVSDRVALVEQCMEKIAQNLWIVSAAHPTAALRIADWLLENTERNDLARNLVCCCLGWRYVYRRVDDLISLAELLLKLKAPKLFWTRIANLYYDFSTLDGVAQHTWIQSVPNAHFDVPRVLIHWKAIDEKEGILHRFCADNGFPERDAVLELLFDAFDLKLEPHEKGNAFPGKEGYSEGEYLPWLSEGHFQMRHPWFCLLQCREQDFIRNGDTAFVTCVTDDYSMACSQWWRCVESVLRRKLIVPLGHLIDANPAWVGGDLDYASSLPPEREIEWEELFVRVLPDARRRKRMSLAQMLILVDKCISDHRNRKTSTSIVRRNAVRHVGEHLSEFRWIKSEMDEFADMRSAFSPNVLTERSIQSFRNAASHDEPMDYEHAVAGRLLAIRILDFMHYPRYCIDGKLDELKLELAHKKPEGSK